MQLSPGERSLLAYFSSANLAQAAAKELKEAGYNDVQVDRISRYGVSNNAQLDNAMAGAETITGLTLYSNGTGGLDQQGIRILRAADPSVSGYGNRDYGVAGGKSFLVTLVTKDQLAAEAEEIIKKHQGIL